MSVGRPAIRDGLARVGCESTMGPPRLSRRSSVDSDSAKRSASPVAGAPRRRSFNEEPYAAVGAGADWRAGVWQLLRGEEFARAVHPDRREVLNAFAPHSSTAMRYAGSPGDHERGSPRRAEPVDMHGGGYASLPTLPNRARCRQACLCTAGILVCAASSGGTRSELVPRRLTFARVFSQVHEGHPRNLNPARPSSDRRPRPGKGVQGPAHAPHSQGHGQAMSQAVPSRRGRGPAAMLTAGG